MSQIHDVVSVQPLDGFNLLITFENGVSGVVDVSKVSTFRGVFEPLLDPDYFKCVKVDPDLGTICWESGADIDPLVLYSIVSGQPINLN